MATISNTPRPGYVWDVTDNVWYPIGVGGHGHSDYITQATAVNPTIIDAKGDIITATAADTPARLAVGNNGETLVADSAQTTGLGWSANYAAGKNKIINGAFNVWQRGTTFTGISQGTYFADRFFASWGAGGASNVYSQQAFTAGTAPVSGYEGTYFARAAATSATTSTTLGMTQAIEDVRTFAGQTVTLSFWAKADSARTGTSYLSQNFGTGGSATVDQGSDFSLTTSWTRITMTKTLGSMTGKTIGANSKVYVEIDIKPSSAAGSPILDIWGVQVEAGSVATAFQTATGTIQGELAACQRYYFRTTGSGVGTVLGAAATTVRGITYFPVPLRVAPTAFDFSGLGANDTQAEYAVSAVSAHVNASIYPILNFTTATGITQSRPYTVYGTYLGYSAEL